MGSLQRKWPLAIAMRGLGARDAISIAAMLAAVGMSAAAIVWLQGVSDGRESARHALQGLQTDIALLEGLEWEAIAEQGTSDALALRIAHIRDRVRTTATRLESRLDTPGEGSHIGRDLTLLLSAPSATALRPATAAGDASPMPPARRSAFERLRSQIADRETATATEAQKAATIARLVRVLLAIVVLLTTGALFLRMSAAKQAARHAFFDPLTGLASRMLFRDRLIQALRLAERQRSGVGVVLVDIDSFKQLNGTHGHQAGDALLKELAARLTAAARASDTVARLDGDEFALVVQGCSDATEIGTVAERVSALVRLPFTIGDHRIQVTGSIGYSFSDRAVPHSELLREADLALEAATHEGGGACVLYVPAVHQSIADRRRLAGDLGAALANNQISVVYQPIVEIKTGRVRSVEALARWTHPVRGPVGPDVFIPLAERNGLIHEIGRFVLIEAAAQLRRWQANRALVAPAGIHVNVSPVQLQEGGILDDVRFAIEQAGIAASQLTLEITESAVAGRGDDFDHVLQALDVLGVKIAVDDFGVGHSSLSSLTQMRIDEIKIDRAFIGNLDDAHGIELIRSIIELGHALGFETVTEGIETPLQASILHRLDCDYGQGFHYGPPQPPHAIDAYLAEQSAA